ncbi:uncharacterized protein N7479_000507 [Penicillium vulpinum]|uniref:Ecp2 effector protein domain-containing protein n=1 Tax=Penicillium vulpinum TaxID=29845 RepID=A0A1V6S5V2_9EURO|nr:uncharacterized protein N7479_000507 [Penicillium vulpinum]KAJ5970589.1 hypothetical protein N7479_000507 [Penicillium vulpinum]OQE09114.1 hypothetical protein PENVUL_c007G05322 [Penicillium vulpinum]
MRFLALSVLAQAISVSGAVASINKGSVSYPVTPVNTITVTATATTTSLSYSTTSASPTGDAGDGTKIHVSSGCISINGVGRCKSDEGAYNIARVEGQKYSTAVIYSAFDSKNNAEWVVPTCILYARWPSSYGDLDFVRNRLMNRHNNYDQPCEMNERTDLLVPNPYYDYDNKHQ